MRLLPLALGALALAAISSVPASGCGSATFSAEELVSELNAHGAEIELGERLAGGPDDIEVYAVSVTTPAAAEGGDHAHGEGSLAIAGGEQPALAEYRRCEEAASLLCFRAANAVLIFDDSLPPDALARIGSGIRAIGEDE